jgi:hypothetical protein
VDKWEDGGSGRGVERLQRGDLAMTSFIVIEVTNMGKKFWDLILYDRYLFVYDSSIFTE